LLKRINLTSGAGGSIGLLKDNGKLQWPPSLQGLACAVERDRLERNAAEIVQRLKYGTARDGATVRDMQADLARVDEVLSKNIAVLSPSNFIAAKRYLNQLGEAIKALQDPNVAIFFRQKWTPREATAAALVRGMSDQGLRFAPAVPGDEAAYTALYRALAAFDAGLQRLPQRMTE
jgi:hypothetical protein